MGWKNCQAGFEALHSSSVHTSSFIITLNVDVTAHFFLDNMAGFFHLPPRGQDVTELHRMNTFQDLLSPSSTPFPLTPLAGTQGNWQVKVECPLQPTPPWSFSFFLLSDPLCLIPLPMLPWRRTCEAEDLGWPVLSLAL